MSGTLLPTLLLIALVLLGIAIVVAIILAYKYLSIKGQIADYARREFEQWRASEIETIKQDAKKTAEDEANIKLEGWKSQYVKSIREDAKQRSRSTIMGKSLSNLSPTFRTFPTIPKTHDLSATRLILWSLTGYTTEK